MNKSPFEQNIIAMVWDCDKTLISNYMQEPLFKHFNVDGPTFWAEVNSLIDFYGKKNIHINPDTSYLNHVLTYVKEGIFKGLSNKMLKEFGKELEFYPGLPEFFSQIKSKIESDSKFKAFGIKVEHYVVSTGFAETIRGSKIAPFVEGIFGCEFIEIPAKPGYNKNSELLEPLEGEISQVASALDNTSKTRYLFEINKGSNIYPETINVNSSIEKASRRVPFENMIYIADGPSDVPAFSILNYNGGSTFAVYPKGNLKAFRQVDGLRRDNRVQMFGEADYTEGSQSWMWLTEKVFDIANKILQNKQDIIRKSASMPPSHISN